MARATMVALLGALCVAPLWADPLGDAVRDNDLEAARVALDAGADPNGVDKWDQPVFLRALRSSEMLGLLLDHGADANAKGRDGDTALHHAAVWVDGVDAARMLIEHAADVDALNDRGSSPLMRAAALSIPTEPFIEAIVENGAAVDLEGPRGQTALHMAVAWGAAENVAFLLEHGAAADAVDAKGMTPLHGLGREKAREKYRLLLAAGADLEARDRHGRTPLHALLDGFSASDKAIAALIEAGAEINSRDGAGRTPLDCHLASRSGLHQAVMGLLRTHRATGTTIHAAAAIGDLGKALQLVERGADPDQRDWSGRAPLHWLPHNPRNAPEVAEALLAAGADPNLPVDPTRGAHLHPSAPRQDWWDMGPGGPGSKATPLMANAGSAEVIALLLADGADPNRRGGYGSTALHSRSLTVASARLLIGAGADVDAVDTYGNTPLDDIGCCADAGVVGVLLEAGADPNRGTPLADAAGSGEADAVRLLLKHGADPDHGGALMAATERGHKRIVEILLTAGADPRRPGGWREETMLHAAVASEDMELVELALDFGVSPNARDKDGRGPLQRTLRHGGIGGDTWELLVDVGADPMAVDNEGFTPLDWVVIIYSARSLRNCPEGLRKQASSRNIHTAALHGDIDALRAFLDGGTSPNARHFRDGKTPMHWAARKRHREAVEFLLDRGADPNAHETNGRTPLQEACIQWGKVPDIDDELIELLIRRGGDPRAEGPGGKSARDRIERRGFWSEEVGELMGLG